MNKQSTSEAEKLAAAEALACDRQLAARCLAGEQPAMRELVDRHQLRVLRLCQRMMGSRHDAEDVVQETFVRALKSLSRWDQTRRFEPWLLAIAANRCRTALGKRKATACEPHLLADSLPAKRDPRPSMEHLDEEVNLALEGVRDDHRQAFELFHRGELAYAEIAEVLSVPVGTVKTWVHRARREVAATLIRRGVVELATSNQPVSA